MSSFITLHQVVSRMVNSPFAEPMNWVVQENEVWAIVGKNGSGKSLLSEVIVGKYPLNTGLCQSLFENLV
ncbi:ATP-binding cassette domain-containing protein [Paludibacter sp. 221]|uniref:ATP-binding cassette domain-containing protein n=1 Tax=Paludibacter sp. 221 TaxID=2302939 RepID=UPI0013CFA976|nr:ATP-binding cassette domain-containing protein [Paludibacter sp. 221]NDV46676.1 ATP-binding cassette domain-containing protein [Paludibacter sp. 221]